MKHSGIITALLLLGFVLSQLIGIYVINSHIERTPEGFKFAPMQTVLGPVEQEQMSIPASIAFIVIGLLFGIILIMILNYFGWKRVWKFWYGFAMFICINIVFSSIMSNFYSAILSFILVVVKLVKRNVIVHNLTEIISYAGLAALFSPLFSSISAMIVLVIFSVYDFIAVLKSGFMLKLANFQASSGAFAGLVLPYKEMHKTLPYMIHKEHTPAKETKIAVLGGGDIAFPLLFTGTIVATHTAFQAMLIIPFTALSLLILFTYGKKGKPYPALPFVTAGCLIGWIVVRLVSGYW